jgi:hypothetical protein
MNSKGLTDLSEWDHLGRLRLVSARRCSDIVPTNAASVIIELLGVASGLVAFGSPAQVFRLQL